MRQGEEPLRIALRTPGQYARERGLALHRRVALIALFAGFALFAAWRAGMQGFPFLLFELAAIGLMVGASRLYSDQADRWLRGAAGERAVGTICAGLEANGWQAIHDVSLGRGNIDHILVGPGGIFTIETKSHRGGIPVDHIDPKMLKQAYAQKKLLERITGRDVQPLLVFSRAYLVGPTPPVRRNGITILPARMLQHYFSRQRPIMAAEHADRVYRQLAMAFSSPS